MERFGTSEILLRHRAAAVIRFIRGSGSTVQTGLNKGADALDSALEILGRYVSHIANEECQTLTRFDKSQWIMGQLQIIENNSVTPLNNVMFKQNSPICGRGQYYTLFQELVCLSNVQFLLDGRQKSSHLRRLEHLILD